MRITTPRQTPRRWPRLKLWSLMAIVLISAVWMGWIVTGAHAQRTAVAEIQKVGGYVKYDWEWKNNQWIANSRPWAPKLLVDLLGVDYFGTVVYLNLYENEDADRLLVHASQLRRLEYLDLALTAVNDDDLAQLAGLTHLRCLSLIDTEITDAGLTHIQGLARLDHLRIDHTEVSDAGLANLEPLAALQGLWLGGAHITDAGLVHLKRLKNLAFLTLDETRVTDAGVKDLQLAATSVEDLPLGT